MSSLDREPEVRALADELGLRSPDRPVDAIVTPSVPSTTSTIGDGMMNAAGLPPSMKRAANTATMPRTSPIMVPGSTVLLSPVRGSGFVLAFYRQRSVRT